MEPLLTQPSQRGWHHQTWPRSRTRRPQSRTPGGAASGPLGRCLRPHLPGDRPPAPRPGLPWGQYDASAAAAAAQVPPARRCRQVRRRRVDRLPGSGRSRGGPWGWISRVAQQQNAVDGRTRSATKSRAGAPGAQSSGRVRSDVEVMTSFISFPPSSQYFWTARVLPRPLYDRAVSFMLALLALGNRRGRRQPTDLPSTTG